MSAILLPNQIAKLTTKKSEKYAILCHATGPTNRARCAAIFQHRSPLHSTLLNGATSVKHFRAREMRYAKSDSFSWSMRIGLGGYLAEGHLGLPRACEVRRF